MKILQTLKVTMKKMQSQLANKYSGKHYLTEIQIDDGKPTTYSHSTLKSLAGPL